MDAQRVRECIRSGRLAEIYSSYEWQKLAQEARERQHNECQRCKARGFYVPCDVVHHKLYVKSHPERVFDINNLECLCRECHEKEHGRLTEAAGTVKGYINEERW